MHQLIVDLNGTEVVVHINNDHWMEITSEQQFPVVHIYQDAEGSFGLMVKRYDNIEYQFQEKTDADST